MEALGIDQALWKVLAREFCMVWSAFERKHWGLIKHSGNILGVFLDGLVCFRELARLRCGLTWAEFARMEALGFDQALWEYPWGFSGWFGLLSRAGEATLWVDMGRVRKDGSIGV